jgi:hypothetical protein
MRISNPRKKESPKKGAGRGKTEPKIENFRKQSRKQAGSKRKQAIVPNSPSGFQKEKLITVGRYGSKECEKRLQSEERNGQEINRRNTSATKWTQQQKRKFTKNESLWRRE